MKKIILITFLLVTYFNSWSQIRFGTQAEKTPLNEKYDSLSPYVINAKQLIGQDVCVLPIKSILKESGYTGFYKDKNLKTKLVKKGIIPEEMLVGKIFKVTDALEINNDQVVELKNGNDIIYHVYNSNSFQILPVGYVKKAKQIRNSDKYVLKFSPTITNATDYETGEKVKLMPGTVWKFIDVVIDSKKGDILFLYENENKNKVVMSEKTSISTYFVEKERLIKKKEFDILLEKYGQEMIDKALEGKIIKGMSKDVVRFALGEPKSKNVTSYSEQWVYAGIYVYFENGVVSAWN